MQSLRGWIYEGVSDQTDKLIKSLVSHVAHRRTFYDDCLLSIKSECYCYR